MLNRNDFTDRADVDSVDELDWQVRAAIYRVFVATGQPPTVTDLAAELRAADDRIGLALLRLEHRHALVLELGSFAIRMANPFSGIPTRYQVMAQGHTYWANCAWDMLGIPAALHSDAVIQAQLADSNADSVRLEVRGDHVDARGEVVYFALPFRDWYADLIHT